jgi:hypothetical protein
MELVVYASEARRTEACGDRVDVYNRVPEVIILWPKLIAEYEAHTNFGSGLCP